MRTTEPNGTQTAESPRSKLKRWWPLIALAVMAVALILGELAFQWARHRGWTTYTEDDGLASISVRSIAVGPDGAIWLGTAAGVSRLDDKTWTTYTQEDGMADNVITSIAVAPHGTLWFGTTVGVSRFDGETWTTYTEEDGLTSDAVTSVVVAPDGALWFGTGWWEEQTFVGNGVFRFDGLTWTTYTANDGLADDGVRSITVAPDGAVWFGTDGGDASRFDGATWTTYTANDGLADSEVRSIGVAPDGTLWFGTGGGGVSCFDGEAWTTYTVDDGLASNYVGGIVADPDGAVWARTWSSGISRFDGETWATYTTVNSGLADQYVWSLAIDDQGRAWIGTGGGLSVLDERNSFPAQTLQVWAGAWLVLRVLGIALLVLLALAWIVRLVHRKLGSRLRRQVALLWFSVILVVLLGWASKVITMGWVTIISLGIPYLAVGIIHFIVHWRTISKVPEAKPSLFALVFASHAFFLLGFLLQADAGDGPDWLTLTYLVGGLGSRPPTWWPELILMNVLVFAPLVLSWVLLPRKSFYHRAEGEADQPITELEPLAESDTEGLVDVIRHSSEPEES